MRRRLKKLRFAAIAMAALFLALISFLFGIFIAVTQDLPRLEDRYQFTHAKNSVLLDDQGRPLAILSNHDRILLSSWQIPPIVKKAVVSVEDKRFYSEPGIDPKGIARAALADILQQHAAQGASTITEQFVKNALEAESERTILEKLREAALAYQLARRWPKEKILTEYLDTIYFGEGAYGIEAAAETYFGHTQATAGCGLPKAPLCVAGLKPGQAALLAGIIASPSGFDPVTHPLAARERRDLVLKDMREQHDLSAAEYSQGIAEPLPTAQEVQPPQSTPVDGLQTGYFTSWVEQQLIERYGTGVPDEGLAVHTTLDLDLQRAAEQAVRNYLPGPEGPTASLVAIENSTGDVRAMVGGRNFDSSPFNIATNGERQPGSAFKAFDLAAALEHGISPYSVWTSAPKVFNVHGPNGLERFAVHNDLNAYAGSRTLLDATAYSDNSVFAEVGIDVGTRRIASLAHRMGIQTPISTNPAMTIGGLRVGVSPLEMAHAYETIAHGGQRVDSSLLPDAEPTGIQEVVAQPGEVLRDGRTRDVNHVTLARVLPAWVASEETSMLEAVIQYGTARNAAIGQFAAGKTGTTTNFGDAWFVGWDDKYTVAVWVGYPKGLVPMNTDYNGGPVEGGTFPALIWHDFMIGAMEAGRQRAERSARQGSGATGEAAGLGAAGASSPSAGAPEQEASRNGARRGPPGAASPQQAGPEGTGAEHGQGTPSGPSAPQPTSPSPSAPGGPARSSPSAPAGGPGAGEEGGSGTHGGGGSGAGTGGATPSSGGGAAPGGGG